MTVAELVNLLRDLPDQDQEVVLHIDDSGTYGYTSNIWVRSATVGWRKRAGEPEHDFLDFCDDLVERRTVLVFSWGDPAI
jgi:hypothetical protein